ncbi:hypothetical protein C8J57DRAFT_1523226 [Mycena rebaudengoi]|nr:hypothetical protein C8J57DRAFT_1523226 [Mycena rebaudengoi]
MSFGSTELSEDDDGTLGQDNWQIIRVEYKAMLNVVCTMPQRLYDTTRVVAISSNGLTPEGHAKLPFAMRLVYAYLLPAPHRDKVGLEFVLAHCGGRSYSAEVPGDDIMGPLISKSVNI